MDPKDLPRLLVQGLEAQSRGSGTEARGLLGQVLSADPNNVAALYSLAALDANEGQVDLALAGMDAAIARRPDFVQARLARAQLRLRLGQAAAALGDVHVVLRQEPESTAAQALLRAMTPSLPSAGGACPQALVGAMEQAQALQAQGRTDAAVAAYAAYLKDGDRSVAHVALYNAGVLLSQAGRPLEAEAYMRQSVALKADFVIGRIGLGQMAEANGRPQDAIAAWTEALLHADAATAEGTGHRVTLLNHLGRLHEVQRDYPQAEAALAESLQLKPDQPPVLHHWIHLRQKQCAWPVIPGPPARQREVLASASALAMLGLADDPAEQLAAARRFVEQKVGRFERRVPRGHRYGHDRLRIGYLSSDLSMHAVSLLTVELFERHHRDRVEVHAFCWSREDGTPFRERVRRAFDRFHRIDGLDDEAAAELIRAQEIDVLVDLHGLTSNARPNIVARGPAPLQVAFLGFPGPTALPHMDFVVADPFIFPDALCAGFTEAPLVLPTLYQCSDSQRPIGARPTRAQLGLPEDRFVFCAFNNNFKFTPEVFECWMRVLRRVPDAVLWLLEDNPWSRAHLQQAAGAHGVDPARLIFAPRVQPADYLARFAAADLFLDTYPYNAGTTANDALWAGLPLLTLSGRTYVSRMAGSLLTSAGLQELVTFSAEDYERVGIEMATDRERLKGLRERLKAEKDGGRLFSTERFAREFEGALIEALAAAAAAAASVASAASAASAEHGVPS
jgi:predicted O-linked N-acetylglucosamine transferase (SPINDLY family)